jgi:hypothetical protein
LFVQTGDLAREGRLFGGQALRERRRLASPLGSAGRLRCRRRNDSGDLVPWHGTWLGPRRRRRRSLWLERLRGSLRGLRLPVGLGRGVGNDARLDLDGRGQRQDVPRRADGRRLRKVRSEEPEGRRQEEQME